MVKYSDRFFARIPKSENLHHGITKDSIELYLPSSPCLASQRQLPDCRTEIFASHRTSLPHCRSRARSFSHLLYYSTYPCFGGGVGRKRGRWDTRKPPPPTPKSGVVVEGRVCPDSTSLLVSKNILADIIRPVE